MFTRTEPGSIWLHAVSVGEVASAIPLLGELRGSNPKIPIYVSTSTVAGRRAAEQQLSDLVNGVFYAPIDYVFSVRKALRVIRPALVIVFETEIWPNLYNESKRTGAALAIVNGRISDRTWPRYSRAGWLFGPVLSRANVIFAQSETDYRRYRELGVPVEKLGQPGNLKYDASLVPGQLELPTFGARQIWIAASTVGPNERGSIERHETDEDDIVIRSFLSLAAEFPGLLLILAPRQPARFEIVSVKLKNSGVHFMRRSDQQRDPKKDLALPGVLLLDSIGELSRLYSLANVAFVGGSLAPRGGHNILEPAAAGVPVIVGPHMHNFQAIARDFIAASAIVQINGADELTGTLRQLLSKQEFARQLGGRARIVVGQKQGVAKRIADQLWKAYYGACPSSPTSFLSRLILGWLASAWIAGGRLKRRQGERRASSVASLSVPVISIGGITVGGSGKTPFAKYLADRLKDRGYAPAILTRGYRRRSPAENLVFAPGAKVPPAYTGDEAQIFLRAGVAPIGIGANRYDTARLLLSKYPETGVLLLDDGFQHARLKRDVDLVVIDGLDPFGSDHAVPLGRLREPLDALARADIFVVTRAPDDRRFDAIQSRLHEYNPTAPVFRSLLKSRGWRDNVTGARIDSLGTQRVAAFCGLGNPQNFWGTLESLGLEVVFRWAFRDHHQYKATDIRRVAHQAHAHGAGMLVTTEKDRVNLPTNLNTALGETNLAWLEIDLELDDERAFFSALDLVLERKRTAKAGERSSGASFTENGRFVRE
ncbi:MAG: tetraacyldisaccharide 4'-kinase [Acidobacteriota bacterium]|nr:tetraacyldisaccharide 4'-kinase [Acidobacteriota bacterium]